MKTALGQVLEDKPISFQEGQKLETSFKELGNQTFGFSVLNANINQPLTIDPSVAWATYYGGSGTDYGSSCSTDAAGNVYLAGYTASTNFPIAGAFQVTLAGGADAFLVKFNSTGSRLWATYYGGSNDDNGRYCATDVAGNVYLAGYTESTNFPVAGAFQGTYGGGFREAFLVKFNGTGSRLWATYYGGSGSDEGNSCVTDAAGNVYLAGQTESTNFPVAGAFQGTFGGSVDAFLVKFNSTGSRLWATYYGGSGADSGFSCATDAAGNVYLAGSTRSTNLPVSGAFQGTRGGIVDAFLINFSSTGSRLWATYYGGSDNDFGRFCATDADGNVYLAGSTESTNFRVAGAFQGTGGGAYADAFLVKFNSFGSRLWATYYGGSGYDVGSSCATDAAGNVYLAGYTASTNFPVTGAFQGTNGGTNDAFLVKFTDSCTPPATPTITASGPTTFCTGGSVTLTAPAGFTYLRSTNETSQSINVTAGGSYTVQTIANGCTSSVSAVTVVTVNTPPTTPTINAGGPTTFCTGGSVTLTAPAGFSYIWSTTETSQSINVTAGGSYTVRTIANGCTSATSAATVVTVNTPPTTPTTNASGPTTFCTGGSVTLTAPSGFSYLWSTTETSQSINVTAGGSYTVRTIANGCTSAVSAAIVVTGNTPPTTPTITPSGPTTFCTGGFVTLSAPAGFSYLWSTTETSQSINVTAGGSYTVQTIANGCTSAISAATVVTVNTPPTTPTITPGGPTTFCTGGSVTLSAPAGFTYLWSTTETSQSINVTAGGSYTVQTIANGCTSAVSTATVVTVSTPPTTPTINAGGPTTFCTGGSVTLTAPAGFTYLWSTTETSQSINVTAGGSYTVRTIANGCTSAVSAATVVTVNTPPSTPTINAGGPTTFCTGGSVTLTAPAGFTYLWSTTETSQSINVTAGGSYTVQTIANGCTSATSAATVVTVNTPPTTPTINAGGPTTFCTGGSVTLTAPAGFSYLWSTNGD